MKEKDILESLKKQNYYFKDKSVLELQQIMTYLNLELKNKNKNWSIKTLNSFLEKNNINPHTLEVFYKEYSKRKKNIRTFENFLASYDLKRKKKTEQMLKKMGGYKIELLDKSQSSTVKFLREIREFKNKYLECTDNDFIEMISKNIKTKYSYNTLRNFYYNNNIDTEN